MNWLINRLKELSTWQGIIAGLTALGVSISPELSKAIAGAGVAVFFLISVLVPDKK